jgi:hypothetical protein
MIKVFKVNCECDKLGEMRQLIDIAPDCGVAQDPKLFWNLVETFFPKQMQSRELTDSNEIFINNYNRCFNGAI